MAALITVPLDNPSIPADVPDDAFVLALSPDAVLDADGASALAEAATHFNAVAWYGDIVVSGRRERRPGWSPTRLLSNPTAAMPIAVRASWLRAHHLSAADPALALRLAESEALVGHLPQVLTTHDVAVVLPTIDQVQAHLLDRGLPADVAANEHGFVVTPRSDFAPALTIVIPTAGATHDNGQLAIDRLLDSLDPLPPHVRILLVTGDEFAGDIAALAARPSVKMVQRPPGPFNFSTAINQGVLASRSELVLLLNDDMEAADTAFLATMAMHLADPTVAAVGALLTYPDGTVQHAGVVIDDARPLHPWVGWNPAATAEHGGLVARDVAAVTGGCLMARRADLLAIGGLSASFPLSFNDIDLCVRLRRTGGRVVIEPAATLVHYETLSRAAEITPEEWDRWIDRWGEIVDPWYHPDFDRPDDPDDLAKNVDHRPPTSPVTHTGPPRLPLLKSRVHRGRHQHGAV